VLRQNQERNLRFISFSSGAFPTALLAFLAIATPSPAYAYIDAGVCSMILQLLLGGIGGALVVLKLYWHRIKRVLSPGSDEEKPQPAESELHKEQ
jgi:hypothetical protein